MSGKLRDYQVLDVLCGGTFYKVRHKVTNNIFAWKAYDCSAYSDEQIKTVVSEVKTISKVQSESLLRYYDTILHGPSKTLYFVLEYNSWQSLEELITVCTATDKYISEGFIWYLLLELARVCKSVENVQCVILRKCVSPTSILVGENCELRVNCFSLEPAQDSEDLMRQVGAVAQALCRRGACHDEISQLHYSDDLRDVVHFLTDEKNSNLRPDVVLYHPTVLANLETLAGPKHLSEILVTTDHVLSNLDVNKCDSVKVVDLCRAVEPAPRSLVLMDSPIYCNITPKHSTENLIEASNSTRGSMSPTLAALALELPGFVPRCRRPYSQALERHNPQQVSRDTLSQQWMTRIIALRQREESLNKRERELIAKEIVNSPTTKFIPLRSPEVEDVGNSNGITLPPMVTQADRRESRVFVRRQRRGGSVRARRKSVGYEDLDSSLSADPGDGSMIITAAKITKENMPRRNIFPDMASKKVHFTSSNPFVESDESVTLTFYELENVDKEGYQVPRQDEKVLKDISKFKYLDLEKLTSDKRTAMQWSQSSPSKQAKLTKKIFSDITNTNMRKTPSKTSLTSKSSTSSRFSMMSCKSQWSNESAGSRGEGPVADRTRASARMSLAPAPPDTEVKKSKRKSLLPFKTSFKFMTSTKI